MSQSKLTADSLRGVAFRSVASVLASLAIPSRATVWQRSNPRVLNREGMPVDALRLVAVVRPSKSSPVILLMRDRLQVSRVHAPSIAAQVIKMKSVRDGACRQHVGKAMRPLGRLLPVYNKTESTVPLSRRGGPLPASLSILARQVDFGPKPFLPARGIVAHHQPHSLVVKPGTLTRRRALYVCSTGGESCSRS